MATEKIEQVLSKLLVPDTSVIQQATQELRQIMKDPAVIPVLCSVLAMSQNAQIRQYAAVLLRRRILKTKQWRSLSPDVTLGIRQNLLQVLLREPEKSVRKSLAQLIATVAKHELPGGRWPELLQFIEEFTHSQDSQQREVGMYVLSTLTSTAAEQLKTHYVSLIQLCSASLDEQQNNLVPFYAIQTLTNLVPFIGSDEAAVFQQVIPKINKVIQGLMQTDEDNAIEALEIFDELLECEVSILAPHVRALMEFCMQISANKELSSSLRVKCLSIVANLIRLKKKSLLKLNIILPLLEMLYPIMCEAPKEDEEEEFEEAEASTASSYACQVLDTMALHFPPEKLIPHLMKPMEISLQSSDPYQRKAAYLTMAVCADGCADYIRTKLLKDLLQQIYRGLQDAVPLVKNAALFALGQFSEHLQPDISRYSAELLPVLFDCLDKASQDVDKDPKGVTKTFYAVEMFCENLEKDILPYLPQLMNYLLGTIATSQCLRAKELAISAVGAVANAAKEEIGPYFSQVIELLSVYLAPTEEEGPLKVQTQALDTLAVLARTLGENFRPLANEYLQTGLKLLTDATDPDLRRCLYGLFAALSTILKAEMAEHLDGIVKYMIEAIQSTEDIILHVSEEDSQMIQIFALDEEETDDGGDEDEEDDEEVQGYSIDNAYIDEKADACTSLGELSVNIGAPFLVHMETVFKEVTKLLDDPAADIRKAAVAALAQFCICVANVAMETKAPEAQTAMYTMLSSTLPKFLMIIQEDVDRQVTMAALENLDEVIEKVGEPVVQYSGMTDRIMTAVKTVIQEKVACQGVAGEVEADLDEDKDLSEYDGMLIETAAEILPKMCRVIGGQSFKPYFADFLPELLKRLKPSRHISEQSFAVGTIAECLEAMGSATVDFVQHLYPTLSKLIQHQDNEVRSNAIFAIGVLAANGVDAIYSQYPVILKSLFDALNKESDKRALDNICAAVCRMIMARTDAVPLEQVLPVVIQCLPLKDDFEENSTVYSCIVTLYDNQHDQIIKHLPQLLHIIALVIGTDQLKPDTQTLVVNLVRDINQRHPDIINQTVSSMSADLIEKLQACITSAKGW